MAQGVSRARSRVDPLADTIDRQTAESLTDTCAMWVTVTGLAGRVYLTRTGGACNTVLPNTGGSMHVLYIDRHMHHVGYSYWFSWQRLPNKNWWCMQHCPAQHWRFYALTGLPGRVYLTRTGGACNTVLPNTGGSTHVLYIDRHMRHVGYSYWSTWLSLPNKNWWCMQHCPA
ncbi:hypothetical protein J6590_034286 [Homalodisca vitripennis]|nr:hypothetical protein J6590_034286 [Homalodisca vitripennis]